MPWSCCSFTVIYMLYIKHPNSNDYMHLALDVSDESRRTVVQNADDRLITHILSFGYITHTVWMSVSVLLFVSFIGLLNTWLSTMSNDSKIGKVIYRNSDRLKWILFCFFSLWKHLTGNGCIVHLTAFTRKGPFKSKFHKLIFWSMIRIIKFFLRGYKYTTIWHYAVNRSIDICQNFFNQTWFKK